VGGVWAQSRARSRAEILASSNFKVFVGVRAHPLSNSKNVAELNPQFFGNNSVIDIEERIFYNAPVGMGEEVFGEVCYNLAHNQKKLIFLKIKMAVARPHYSSVPPMLQKYTLFTPTTYSPTLPSSSRSVVSDDFFLASFSKVEKNAHDALAKAKIHKCNP
jgi:hypothetical protein